MFRCLICDKGPRDGVAVFRINKKGDPGVFVCMAHHHMTDAPPLDPSLKAIAKAFSKPEDP
jgi:hypothetical protein